MSLIKKTLDQYQIIIQEHKSKRPVVIDDDNYKAWLSECIQLENTIKKLNDKIKISDAYKKSTAIYTNMILESIIIDVNDDIEFEFMQWYESAPLNERSNRLKKFIIDGFLQNQKYI